MSIHEALTVINTKKYINKKERVHAYEHTQSMFKHPKVQKL